MKFATKKWIVSAAGVCLATGLAVAQNAGPNPETSGGSGNEGAVQEQKQDGILDRDRLQDGTAEQLQLRTRVIGTEEARRIMENAQDGVRPEMDGANTYSEQLRERLRQFQAVRERFLEQQRKMMQELQNASEVEREAVRAQIRENRQDWLDQAKMVRETARERMEALKERLPDHQEALDAARERVRERVQDAKEQARERRGLD